MKLYKVPVPTKELNMNIIEIKNKVRWLENKKFRHFDNPHKTYEEIKGDTKHCIENAKTCEDIKKIVSNPEQVAKHSFYPFIAFNIQERKVSKIKALQEEIRYLENKIDTTDDEEDKVELKKRLEEITENFKEKVTKTRPIKYASHMDGHIYGYYASQILLPHYEQKVQEYNLDKEILAYRSIPDEYKGNKDFHRASNVTMAKEIFEQILLRKCQCVALAYDLKSFYDTIDHKKLKEAWCKVMDFDKLPADHYNIYKSLTKFCFIDLKKVCEYFNYKKYCCSKDGKVCGNCSLCRNPKTNKLPKILFKNASEFRKFKEWCGNDAFQQNKGLEDKDNPYGIPQGSALSSVLSNIYMLDFDIKVKEFLEDKNAVYRRYCDDIMIVCNKEDKDVIDKFLRDEIEKQGQHLKIHDIEEGFKYSKSQVYDFTNEEKITKQPLQYLGFCFDGKIVTIRGNSLSRYYRKAYKGIVASRLNVLRKLYDIHIKGLPLKEKYKKLYRRKLYERYTTLGKNNFHTYVKRAFSGMEGIDNKRIRKQLSNHMKKIKRDIDIQDTYISKAWDLLSNLDKPISYDEYLYEVYSK